VAKNKRDLKLKPEFPEDESSGGKISFAVDVMAIKQVFGSDGGPKMLGYPFGKFGVEKAVGFHNLHIFIVVPLFSVVIER